MLGGNRFHNDQVFILSALLGVGILASSCGLSDLGKTRKVSGSAGKDSDSNGIMDLKKLSVTGVSFEHQFGSPSVKPQNVQLSSLVPRDVSALNWQIENNCPWLDVSPTRGGGDREIVFTPNTNGLGPGRWTTELKIHFTDGTGVQQITEVIPVSLQISTSSPAGLTNFSLDNSDLSDWAAIELQTVKRASHGAAQSQRFLSYLNEDRVFRGLFSYSGPGKKWKIKIGQGGQIYSFKIESNNKPGAYDEIIAKQRAEVGQWVDEVWQHTLPGKMQKDVGEASKSSPRVDNDIHQAGFYMKSDLDADQIITDGSTYSPTFDMEYDPAQSSVSYHTWPQHAHLPRFRQNTVLPSGESYLVENYEMNRLLMKQTVGQSRGLELRSKDVNP